MLKKLSQFIDFGGPAPRSYRQETSKSYKSSVDSFDFISLIKDWKLIAGDKLSEHTIPLKNQNGTLMILSNHSAFASELSYMEVLLKKKIFERFPSLEKSVSKIKFIVDSTHFEKQYLQFVAPVEKIKKQNSLVLHPYSPEFRRLKKEADLFFSETEDPQIKETLVSLYIQSESAKSGQN